MIFAFTFAKKLFPPFIEIGEGRFIVGQNFNGLPPLAVQNIAQCRVLIGRVAVKFSSAIPFPGFSSPPRSIWAMSIPATAMGSRPTGVSTEKRPPPHHRG